MEVAGVILKDGEIIYKYSEFVKSSDGKYKCNDFARKMHGISDELANKKGKYPIQIMQDLQRIKDKFFDGSPMTIVAHNAAFDISFIKRMFTDGGSALSSTETSNELDYDKIFSRNAIDTATMALLLRLQGKLPFERCSLDNILKFYEISIPVEERHSALSDAQQTAKAFLLMFNALSNNNEKLNLAQNKEQNKVYDKGFNDSEKLNKTDGCVRTL